MKKSVSNSEKLGYYFIIFHSTLNENYIKCWLDGNEDYVFKTRTEFYNLFEKIDSDFKLKLKLLDCLDTTGIYIWDIDNETISQLHSNQEFEDSLKTTLIKTSSDYIKNLDRKDEFSFQV